jgi:hypothetical protein
MGDLAAASLGRGTVWRLDPRTKRIVARIALPRGTARARRRSRSSLDRRLQRDATRRTACTLVGFPRLRTTDARGRRLPITAGQVRPHWEFSTAPGNWPFQTVRPGKAPDSMSGVELVRPACEGRLPRLASGRRAECRMEQRPALRRARLPVDRHHLALRGRPRALATTAPRPPSNRLSQEPSGRNPQRRAGSEPASNRLLLVRPGSSWRRRRLRAGRSPGRFAPT